MRNDEWARDYLDRFATALESRPLLCSTSTFPENAAAASVTTEADRCHYARVTSLLDHAPHLVSVEAKRDPDAVDQWVAGVRNATACWTRPRRARVLDRGRAILKPGIAPKPFVPIRYDPDDQAPFSPRSALCGGLGVCPGPKKCYEKVNDDRATYKEGVRAAYKCAEGPPGSKWNLAADTPPSRRVARRAYKRAREELKMLEREAQPTKIN